MCRENCSYSLSKMAEMVLTLIPTEISAKWYQIFKSLAADPCYIVRKAVAGSFYEIVRVLGKFQLFKDKLVKHDNCRTFK